MYCVDVCVGQYCEYGFGYVWYVDYYMVIVVDVEVFEYGGEVVYFVIQLVIGDFVGVVGFGGNCNQCELVGVFGQVVVDGVVVEIGFVVNELVLEWWVVVIEYLLWWFVLMDVFGFFVLEGFWFVD